MKNRGELGCALVLVAALVVGVIYLISQAPWLFLAAPVALVLVVLAIAVLADVTSDDVLMTTEEPGGFVASRVSMINRLRRAVGKPLMWQAPKNGVTFEERQMIKQAVRLSGDILNTLRNSPTSVSDRDLIRQQADEIPGNMVQALWRLDRLRRVSRALDPHSEQSRQQRDEMQAMEHQVLAGMQHALDTLSAIPVSLMKVEMAQADRPVQRLLANLSETNQQLRDLSATYDELRNGQTGEKTGGQAQ
jgi:hypothetical protein